MNKTYNLYNLDLSHWGLSVAAFKISMDDGIHRMDISLNSTIATFEGYDKFVQDMAFIHTLRQRCETDYAVKDAYDKLLTVMAMTGT